MESNQSQPTRAAFTYLKAIYDCGDGTSFVTTSQLAEHLKVAPASVTAMSQKLAASNPPLVEYHKHHGVRLLPIGEQHALRIIRRHRLLETFLTQALGYSWDEVHEEAEELESCISSRLEERLARYTGNPSFDPHGAPIPGEDLSLPQAPAVALNQMSAGQKGQVSRVRSTDSGLLRYLSEMGINIGVDIEVVNSVPYDGTMHVRVNHGGDPISLGSSLTSVILLGAGE
jgi:DtxR family transcriptional regulator, Mn-dependent transcriptional regulator